MGAVPPEPPTDGYQLRLSCLSTSCTPARRVRPLGASSLLQSPEPRLRRHASAASPNNRRVCVKMEKTKPCYSTGARRQLPPRQTRLAASTSIPLSLPPCASGRATALTPSGALFGGRAVARAMQPLPGSAQGTRSSRSPRDLFDSSSQGIHGVAWAWDDSPARSGAYGKGPAWRCPRQLDTDLSKVLSDELAFTRRDESWLRAEAHTGFEEPPSTRPVRPPPRTRLSGGRPHVWERDASALA